MDTPAITETRTLMLRLIVVAALMAPLLAGCKKDPIVLLCEPFDLYEEKVALRIDVDASTADLLNPFSLSKEQENFFKSTFISPTVMHFTEAKTLNSWLLDRATGKLSRTSPRRDYYCGTGRRF